jgi:acetyl esterase/lipase
VWNLEYRRVGDPGGGWPGTFLDVGKGVDHLRELAKQNPLDLSRVVVMGHSAGGHFALWVASRKKISETSELYQANPIAVSGVVGLAPASELDALHAKGVCGNVVDKLMGGAPGDKPDRYRWAMPSAMSPIGVRQILLIGKLDSAFGWVGQNYAEKARVAGDKQVEVILAPEAGHMEVIDPASSTWPLVLKSAKELLGIPASP